MANRIKLIKCIEANPPIWDGTHPLRTAEPYWNNVAENTSKKWFNMTLKQRAKYIQKLKRRWKSIRDSYMRVKKHNSQNVNKKKCHFDDHLKFLENVPIPRRNYGEAGAEDIVEFVLKKYEAQHGKISEETPLEPFDWDKASDDESVESESSLDTETSKSFQPDERKISISNQKEVPAQSKAEPASSFQPGDRKTSTSNQKEVPAQSEAEPASSFQPGERKTSTSRPHPIRRKFITKFQSQPIVWRKRREDPDKDFLLSILPDYKKLSSDKKLDFKIFALKYFKWAELQSTENTSY